MSKSASASGAAPSDWSRFARMIEHILEVLEMHVRQFEAPVVDRVAESTNDPFRVLVATMLSARTKDALVASACERLFAHASTPQGIAALEVVLIERLIFPVAFYRNKAVQLRRLCEILATEYGAQVPRTVEGLVRLPGVGRKTANLVVACGFGGDAICVDTHVHRIVNRLGVVSTLNPVQTERELHEVVPTKYWGRINAILVAFGQNVCRPLSPHCSTCPVAQECKKVAVVRSR